MGLDFRDADRFDRRRLELFRCVEGALRHEWDSHFGSSLHHPRKYAWLVQEFIRNRLRPPSKGFIVRLGLLDGELASVGVVQPIDPGELYDLTAVAVSLDARGDFVVADAAMADLKSVIQQACVDEGATSEQIRVAGRIHHANQASKYMCGRAGLSFVGPAADQPDHETWEGDWGTGA